MPKKRQLVFSSDEEDSEGEAPKDQDDKGEDNKETESALKRYV